MKLAIISDIHDNLVCLDKFLRIARAEKIDHLLCCGDVTNRETLIHLHDNFPGTIYLVYGNLELYQPEEANLERINFLGRYGHFNFFGHDIGAGHEPWSIEKILAKYPEAEIIFFGHTHQPGLSEREKVIVVNPGTLGGVWYKASFAVWDSEKRDLQLKILENINL